MSNDPEAARRWLEEQAAQGEPQDDSQPICPMTGTTTCGSGEGCPAC